MKKVLLLGDSIRQNYQSKVIEELKDVCEVVFPEANCANTLETVWHIRIWFEEYGWGKVDLIHWNNGIWDHHRTLDDGLPLSTPEEYLYLNRRLYGQLSRYTDNLIWATTTPAGENYRCDPQELTGIPRDEWNREVALYNDLVRAYLSAQGVAIDDLYSLVTQNWDCIREDGFHLSERGVELLGKQVAACIRAHLG